MNIIEKAKCFAIKAHKGQKRKSDIDKPMIIHPIEVSNILKRYGFDDNVIAAGLLHDVVEDTKYTLSDINKMFGDDIETLVLGDTEIDKSLSWEERKKRTINEVKNLDIRHKAIVCADKISNLSDFLILSVIIGKKDYSFFNRGEEKQKWYYTNIYNSLINNENHAMFDELKDIIDRVFYNKEYDYEKELLGNDYDLLKKFHYMKKEIYKLKSVLNNNDTYVIEFTGTPRTGKTTLINNLKDFFKKGGFDVSILEEFTTSDKYKKEIYPSLKDKYKSVVNTEIPKYVLKELNDSIDNKHDIIIVDRSLFDRLIWIDRLKNKDGLSDIEYNNYKSEYLPLIQSKIDIIIALYTDSITSLKRDYYANLSIEKRSFLNSDNINEYNESLLKMKDLVLDNNINIELIDTTNKKEREISFIVIDKILSDMKKKYIELINEEFK